MNLREAIQAAPLAAGKVVAGADQLDRELSWVQVVDHPDIEAWVERGHLLLSTGYNWPKEGPAAGEIVEKLAAKGTTGVVLAVPHFLDHFPAASVDVAQRIGLPLIELPWEIPFSEITRVVHRDLIGEQGRALARSEQIHRELTEAAVSGNGLLDVAKVLAKVLALPVAITSVDGAVLATWPDQPSAPAVSPEVIARLRQEHAMTRVDADVRPLRVSAGSGLVGYAVRIRTERVGYVWVSEVDSPLTELDLRAVEHAGTVAALQISHQRELMAQEARLGDALVTSLVEGRFEATPASIERAHLMGWDSESSFRLCAVLLDEPNPLSREGLARREEFGTRMRQELERRGVRPLLSLTANQVHVLLPAEVDAEALWGTFQPTRMAMGVSQFHRGVDGMRCAGAEIAELIDHLRPGRAHTYAEMLFPRVLAGDSAAQENFVQRLFGPLEDGKRGQPLLETALALAEEGFHLQRAADRMDVHISTLRYRLGRLSESTGLDLDSVEGRFRLQVAARLYLIRQS